MRLNLTDIEALIGQYENLPLQCDGMTRVINYLLTENGIDHYCMEGMLTCNLTKRRIVHLWIKLDHKQFEGAKKLYYIDYKARLWLGNNPLMPHGIFNPAEYPSVTYIENRYLVLNTTKQIFEVLTESSLYFPSPKKLLV